MREQKFRVWDKIHNKYREPMVYDILNEKIVVRFPIETLKKGEFLLEQYTGLKDVNGNEIAEGDILEDGEGEPFEYWEVKFKDGKFVGKTQGVTEDLFELTDLEIIGTAQEYSESWKAFNVEV